MLDMAFVEEIIPVLLAESSHPTVKGITIAVVSQLGLRGRAAVAAEHRIRPLVIDTIRETFGDEDFEDDEEEDDEFSENEFGFDDDDDEDEFGYDDDEDDSENYGKFADEDDDDDFSPAGDDEEDDDFDDMDGFSDVEEEEE